MDLPYMKILVYALTFLGYAYSGYGSGLLNNLKDAVLAAETVFGDVVHNIISVAEKFRTMHDVFDAAVEENCIFKCPNGEVAKKNRVHTPKSDGCGSLGLQIDHEYLPVGEMTKCCDDHDICYDTCGNDKEVCDMEFKRCLYKYCDSYQSNVGGPLMVKACKGAAKVLFTGTLTLGCKAYIDSQTEACYCQTSKPTYKKKKFTAGAGEL